ncbi:NAD-P-binding protein [Flagelloscypha sp. PMI_526]|nr:NAD-P-binding protein [Flagelloscypha sp. PMI_526]
MSPHPPRVFLITGASSGFGRCLTEIALANGDCVVACVRNKSSLQGLSTKYEKDRLVVVHADVEDANDVKAAFKEAQVSFGRIDVVFNNAGFPIVGEVEAFDNASIRRLFDVNFFGSMNVAVEAVKFMREVNNPSGGHILSTTSVSGIKSLPGLAYFGATKAALELALAAFTDELDPAWNIAMTQVTSGSFATQANKTSLVVLPKHSAYAETLPANGVRTYLSTADFPGSPRHAMQILWAKVSKMPNPPRRWVLGADAATMVGAVAEGLKKDAEDCESLGSIE